MDILLPPLLCHIDYIVTYKNCLYNTSHKWIKYLRIIGSAHSGLQVW